LLDLTTTYNQRMVRFPLALVFQFKGLKNRPLSEPELERWATYWAVVGAFVAFEYVAEWMLSW